MFLDRVKEVGTGIALIENAILKFCEGEFKTLREIAAALGRTPARLRDNYVTHMVADGRLVRKHPTRVHPTQAYKTAGT